MHKTITQEDKKLLAQIKSEADLLQARLDELVERAQAITGEEVDGGFTFDFILNDFGTAEELFERLNIEISE